jgi:hypothetical protein
VDEKDDRAALIAAVLKAGSLLETQAGLNAMAAVRDPKDREKAEYARGEIARSDARKAFAQEVVDLIRRHWKG